MRWDGMWNSHGFVTTFCAFLLVMGCQNPCAQAASAGPGYPAKPIRMLVGLAPGGGVDITARLIAQKLSENLGQTVIVENRSGAAGSIALEIVATSPPDGHTLMMLASGGVAQSALRARLPYDIERDFAPVSLLVNGMLVLVVHPALPVHNVKELIALARAQPGKFNYGSAGVGSGAHFAGELFKSMAGVNMVHVPYKGGAESVTALASGQIDLSFPSIAAALPHMNTGTLRSLAVTSATRTPLLPSLPTLDESGLSGYDRTAWYGLVAPKGVPASIISRLNSVIVKVVSTPAIRESLSKQSLDAQTSTPSEFTALIRREIAGNRAVIKLAGLKPE